MLDADVVVDALDGVAIRPDRNWLPGRMVSGTGAVGQDGWCACVASRGAYTVVGDSAALHTRDCKGATGLSISTNMTSVCVCALEVRPHETWRLVT